MTTKRVIEIQQDEKFQDVTAKTDRDVSNAIGYLSTWAIHSARYQKLHIFCHKNGNIGATYEDGEGHLTYHIHAERREDGSYSFHS